jgi:eukaryotic-like serine/threonine-protein kinase
MLGEYNPTIAFTPLCKAMLHALHYMHTRRLVHSDVHEGNVLIHSKPDAFNRNAAVYDFKLGDFGQTRAVENASSRPTWNLSCIPPEVLDSKEFGPIDHRSDIYQAGLLLLRFYTKCTEQFDEVDIHAGKPREIAEGAGSPITSVIAKMLRRHVNHRTQTALEAWREFDAAMKFQ